MGSPISNMIEKTRLSWIGLSFLLTTTVGDHHFSHNEQIEHRMADKLQARSSDPWPDSYSHWADIPTSEGFHSVHNWEPPKVVLSEQLSIDKEPAKRQVNFLSAPESSIGSFKQHQEFIP